MGSAGGAGGAVNRREMKARFLSALGMMGA